MPLADVNGIKLYHKVQGQGEALVMIPGLGAGHTPSEYAATGIERAAPAERKRRLAESVRT